MRPAALAGGGRPPAAAAGCRGGAGGCCQARAAAAQQRPARLPSLQPSRLARSTTAASASHQQQPPPQQLSERELTVKLSIAASTDKLDLSDCGLSEVPPAVWQLSGLEELSLSGNHLAELPPAVSGLSRLRRLALPGNQLAALPEQLTSLSALEGLWVHGNLLQELPEQLGALQQLQQLSLAGNCLARLPDSLSQLSALRDLNVAGNQLRQLPDGVTALTALTILAAHGNRLTHLPQSGWQALAQLAEVTLAGNQLTHLPDSFAQLGALTELSVADNALAALPEHLAGLSSLAKLHLYGNQLASLPLGPAGLPALQPALQGTHGGGGGGGAAIANSVDDCGSSADEESGVNGGSSSRRRGGNGSSSSGGRLVSLWLEGNPLSPDCAAELVAGMGAVGTSRIGLDEGQLAGRARDAAAALRGAGGKAVRRGVIKGGGPGYFKLQRGPQQPGGSSSTAHVPRALVVAFGSAPGLPNWGGMMRRVYAAAEGPEQTCFDVLYVVDPLRDWYSGGDAAALAATYTRRLAAYTADYGHVLMLGDSMGATGALLCAQQATSVLAFCPQVDLTSSSLRPGRPAAWQHALQANLHAALDATAARVRVFTGTWQHDVDQANLLGHHSNVTIKVFSCDSHRLALALARRGDLVPLLREAILTEQGLASGHVRLANLL